MNFDWSVIDPYLPAIQALPFRNPLTQRDIRTPDFRVFRDDQLEIYFAPFLCLKPEARIVIIGITPGWQQMELAIRTFREGLELGWPRDKIVMKIENISSFTDTNIIAPGGPSCWRRLEQSRRRERGRDHGVGHFADMTGHHMTAEHTRA